MIMMMIVTALHLGLRIKKRYDWKEKFDKKKKVYKYYNH